MQSRKLSIIESVVNTIAGFIVSIFIQLLIYPALDIPVSIGQNVVITLAFTVASIARGYVVRRIFNRIKNARNS